MGRTKHISKILDIFRVSVLVPDSNLFVLFIQGKSQ